MTGTLTRQLFMVRSERVVASHVAAGHDATWTAQQRDCFLRLGFLTYTFDTYFIFKLCIYILRAFIF